jgi:ketosteroid isomerase-like protein
METIEQTNATKTIANTLCELCSRGEFQRAQDELFADDAESIEPPHAQMPSVKGIEAIREKGKAFDETVLENHGVYVSEPVVAGNHFAVTMGMDVTFKDGNRVNMEEVAVYKVENGKIVSEQFFY